MQTISTIAALRSLIHRWREAGDRIAFVPTMGNLHAGHLELVNSAQRHADRVVVSIFVNPTQFGPNEDFASYPRTEEQDQRQLVNVATDVLFLPTLDVLYPRSSRTRISVTGLSELHCGAHRPGHFDGVALVVCKLLNIVQADCLLLGEKDFQQLAVIRCMVEDLNIPVDIIGVPTVREADGLAMSSRNTYLSTEDRKKAPLLYQALCNARDAIQAAGCEDEVVVAEQREMLERAGFSVDYFHLCRRDDLLMADADDQALVLLAAARLGKTRLIDNVYVDRRLEAS